MRIIILLILFASCYGPKCEYQEACSCELAPNGNPKYFTLIFRGCDLCCWHSRPFIAEKYNAQDRQELLIQFRAACLEDKPHCATIKDEWCGVTIEKGVIPLQTSKRKDF